MVDIPFMECITISHTNRLNHYILCIFSPPKCSDKQHTSNTYQNASSIRCSIEQAAAIRCPSPFTIVARSMPLSSARSMSRKSPTLCETGRNVNWHFSLRLGSGTTTCGRPRTYLTVTSVRGGRLNQMYVGNLIDSSLERGFGADKMIHLVPHT